jgi:hypothetical protein
MAKKPNGLVRAGELLAELVPTEALAAEEQIR